MWEHQIVADFKKYNNLVDALPVDAQQRYKRIYVAHKAMIEIIPHCTRLHFSPMLTMPKMQLSPSKTAAAAFGTEYLKKYLPFNPMWVEFDILEDIIVNDPFIIRSAVILHLDDDGELLAEVINQKQQKFWQLNPYSIKTRGSELGCYDLFDPKIQVSGNKGGNDTAQQFVLLAVMNQLQNIIQLVNCKNIVMETATPDIKLQKKRIRKGKQPLFTYKVLKIKIPGSSKNQNRQLKR
jgi:hypothetical protein